MTKMKYSRVVVAFVSFFISLTVNLSTAGKRYPAQAPRDPERITKPKIQKVSTGKYYRLDWCFNVGKNCGEMAANAYCRSSRFTKPYAKAIKWEIDSDIGDRTPTLVMGDQQVCDQSSCDGFAFIVCSD